MSFMRRVLTSVLGLFAIVAAQAQTQASVTGQYQLRPSDDAANVARLSGRGNATGRLALHVTNRFTLEVGDSVRHGRYRMEDDHLTLYVDNGDVLGGVLRDGRIDLSGVQFERGSSLPNVRRFPTDVSTGRLRRIDGVLTAGDPATVEAPVLRPVAPVAVPVPLVPPAVFVPALVAPVVPPAMKPARVSLLKADDCCGAWTVRRNGLEDKGLRMELKRDGTFRFAMTGATSEGTWTVENGEVVLVWTKIDGDVVEPGTVRKSIPLADDASAFQIDTYRYERATGG